MTNAIDAAILWIVKAICLALMLVTLAFKFAFWMVFTPATAFAELLLWLSHAKDAP